MTDQVPTFAIIGHPNEGKSSVLSTLAEDDSVRVSPTPGETTEVQAFPVVIDGREVIRFVDTPGFQNPRQTLTWLQQYQGPAEQLLSAFIAAHRDDPRFRDDCLLLTPIAAGAGVIFVVDGSRPVRNVDRAEMEILRLTGAPRMAVINSKEEGSAFLADWNTDFRKHFNAIRVFNSCRATYRQRIELLQSLQSIDQQLQPLLKTVITSFQDNWQARSQHSAELILELLADSLGYRASAVCDRPDREEGLKQKLVADYMGYVARQEQRIHNRMRALYKHNIFHIDLPQHSILQEDLFSEKTWEFLGLTNKQLILAATLSGATVGAGIDLAAGGISFGVFSTIGGLLGAAGTLLKGRDLVDRFHLLGFKVGGETIQVGPARNIQLLFILIDRSLLFYSHIINWAHGRRDYDPSPPPAAGGDKEGFTSGWSGDDRKLCARFFKAVQDKDSDTLEHSSRQLQQVLVQQLERIAEN